MALEKRQPIALTFLPGELRRSLLNFQKKGVQFGIRKEGRCLVGDEMGLGKTLQAISIAYYYKDEWPLLIVVPSSMKYPWIDEIEKWLPEIEPHEINLIRSGTDISNIATSRINIMGYGLATLRGSSKLLIDNLEKQKFKVVILDESHYLKNRKAGRTKVLHSIAKKAKRKILLSGTPSLARPEELYIQLDIVAPGLFGSFSSFTRRYCEAFMESVRGSRYVYKKWNTRGASHLNELHQLLRKHVMIRRLKKDVLTQLPPKRRQKITFDISDSEYKKELESSKQEYKKELEAKTPKLSELTRLSSLLYRLTGLAKAAPAKQYISDLLDCMENKCLVFSRHRDVMKAMEEMLAIKRIQHIRIAGDVPSSVRGELVHRFQTDKQVRVALLAIEAASFGITLTAADHVVFVELHFTPGIMLQAEDRAHRIGQQNAVNIHYLVARGTLDEVLWGMVRRKVYVTSSALDGILQELQAEEGDQEKSRQLSSCSAWIQEEDELDDDGKSSQKDPSQRDLRAFFSPGTMKPSTSPRTLDVDDIECSKGSNPIREVFAAKSSTTPIQMTIDDSDDDGAMDEIMSIAEPTSELLREEANESVIDLDFPCDVDSRGKLESSTVDVNESPSARELSLPHNPAANLQEGAATSDGPVANSKPVEDENPVKPKDIKFKKRRDGRGFYPAQKCKVQGAETRRPRQDLCKAESQTDSQVIIDSYMAAEDKSDVKVELSESVRETSIKEEEASRQNKGSLLTCLKDVDVQCATFIPKRSGGSECKSNECDWTDSQLKKPTEVEENCLIQKQLSCCGDSVETHADVVQTTEVVEKYHGNPQTEGCQGYGIHDGKTTFTGSISKSVVEDAGGTSVEMKGSSVASKESFGKDCIQALTSSKTNANNVERVSDISPTFSSEKQIHTIVSPSCADVETVEDKGTSDDSLEDFQVSKKSAGTPVDAVQVDVARKQNKGHHARKKGHRTRRSKGLDCGDWACSACTFLNDSQLIECSMCFTPREQLNETEASKLLYSNKESPMDTAGSAGFDCDKSLETPMEEISPGEGAVLETSGSCLNERSSVASDDGQDFVSGPPPWCCTTCTFENHWQLIECSICLTPRRRSQRRANSTWSTPAVERRKEAKKKSSSVTEVVTGDESTVRSKPRNASLKVTETNSVPSVSTPVDTCKSDVASSHGDGSFCDDGDSSRFSNCESTPPFSKSPDCHHELSKPHRESSPNHPPRKRLKLEDSGTVSPVHITDFASDVSDCATLEGCSSGTDSTLDQSREEPSTFESINELKAVAEELFSNSDSEDDEFWWEEDEERASRSRGEASDFRRCNDAFSGNDSPASSSSCGETSGFKRCSDVFSVNELQNKLQENNGSPSDAKDAEQLISSEDWDLLGSSWDDGLLDEDIVSSAEAEENSSSKDAGGSLQDEIDDLADLPLEDEIPDSPPRPMQLMFILSRHTDRAYLYGEDGEPLGINFSVADVENRDIENLPAILRLDYNFKQAKRMQTEWKRMGEGKRRLLRKSGVMFKSPLEGYQFVRQNKKETESRVRHLSKEACIENVKRTAAEVGGHVRLLRKSPAQIGKQRRGRKETATPGNEGPQNAATHPSTAAQPTSEATPAPRAQSTCLQAVNKDGVPLCLFCSGVVTIRGVGASWDTRFCSHDCKEEYQIRTSRSSVRRQLYEAEHGVCQSCRLDAHALFQSIKALPKRERRAFLEKSAFSSLKAHVLNRIITDPKEGLFWEADHIKAVAEGGGECGLDNYRTLCVPCHRRETSDLNRRLNHRRQMRNIAGCADISAFFESR